MSRTEAFLSFFLVSASNLIDGESQNKFLRYATRIPTFYTLVLFPSKNQEEFCC